MNKQKIPKDLNGLKQKMQHYGVSDGDLERLQEEFDEGGYDIEGTKEDVKDPEESMLIDFCRDKLEGKERVFDIIKAILEGKEYNEKKAEKKPLPPKKEKEKKVIKKIERKEEKKENKTASIAAKKSEKKVWIYNKSEEHPDGTVILNAGLIIIPDIVICDEQYLERIEGITYVMKYNNCYIKKPERARFPFSYIKFWDDYQQDEPPTFASIQQDIAKNEGPTYDYLMENPPFDRILPVLEKIIDQLSYPMLNSNPSNEKRANTKPYGEYICKFFETQIEDFTLSEAIKKACVMFKKNTNENNFNTFELFINFIDIYDRILYANPGWKPINITGARGNEDQWRNKTQDERIKQRHFAAKLLKEDYDALNQSIIEIKNGSFFPLLRQKQDKIADELSAFQCISLSYLLFIKAFMCQTGNSLETGGHIYKTRKRKGGKAHAFVAIADPLKTFKYRKAAAKAKQDGTHPLKYTVDDVVINDDDIAFHNENMPLQFDLVILPRGSNEIHDGLEEEHKEYGIEKQQYETPHDKKSIYKLYAQIVETFRRCLSNPKNREAIVKNEDNAKRASKPKRRDNRYCIVFDRKCGIFYIYPPHIKNGTKNIVHFKAPPAKMGTDKNGTATKEKEGDKNTEKEKKDQKEEKKTTDVEVENKFSFISHEYNDLTNFYLTHKCLIPSASANRQNIAYYGLDHVPFVLSAHFHKQRQWHRHPKLRLYQYFNGGGLRFFYKDSLNEEDKEMLSKWPEIWSKDMLSLWPKYFENDNVKITSEFIKECEVFDAVFDLYKCDMQYFRWENAIKRAIDKSKH